MGAATQANQRILDSAAERLGVPKEKVVSNIANYGNTSAASIPLAFDEAVRGKGRYYLQPPFILVYTKSSRRVQRANLTRLHKARLHTPFIRLHEARSPLLASLDVR
jgi:hypothetical protein